MTSAGTSEGWYKDPYCIHQARWFSEGTPTSLVRDGSVESRDEPPDRPFQGQLERPTGTPTRGAAELRSAHATESDPDYSRAAWDMWDRYSRGW